MVAGAVTAGLMSTVPAAATDTATTPIPLVSVAAIGDDEVFALAADHSAVYQWNGAGTDWVKVGGPAEDLYAGGAGLFATNRDSHKIYKYNGAPDQWTEIGNPGAEFAVTGDHLYGLNPDRTAVYEWTGTGTDWVKVGGPAQDLYAGGAGLFATNWDTGRIYKYNDQPDQWSETGNAGAEFAVTGDHLYGLNPDRTAVYEWNGTGIDWTRIGGPAQNLYAGGAGLFATNPDTHNIYKYNGQPDGWDHAGEAGSSFAVGDVRLYGLAPDGNSVHQWNGQGTDWASLGAPVAPAAPRAEQPQASASSPAPTTPEPQDDPEPEGAQAPSADAPAEGDGTATSLAVTAKDELYMLAVDQSGVWHREQDGWRQLSGPAMAVYAGRIGVFATNPDTGLINKYNDGSDGSSPWGPISDAGGDFAVSGDSLYHLPANHSGVAEWHGDTWTQIGGPAKNIYAGGAGFFATNRETGHIYKYDGRPDQWTEVGGPGATFASGHDRLYGIATDHSAVYEWSGKGTTWTRIGGPAGNIYAGGAGLFATHPDTGHLYKYEGQPDQWTEVGGPGATFAVSDTHLYGLSPDHSTTYQWNGTGTDWTRIGGPADPIQEQLDEKLLNENCPPGQNCLQEYRDAKKILETSVTDWMKVNGYEASLNTLGINTILECVKDHDFSSCIEALADAGQTLLGVGAFKKTYRLKKQLDHLARDLPKFLDTLNKARAQYNKLQAIIALARAAKPHLPDQAGVPEHRRLAPQPDGTGTANKDKCGWAELEDVDKRNGNRATGITACLTQSYIDAHPGTETRIKITKPPGYDWAGRTAAHLGALPVNQNINACHLLGKKLSGSGTDPRNLATCARGANDWQTGSQQGDNNMKKYERDVADAVRGGQDVFYRVTATYSGHRTVPIGFRISAYGITPGGGPGIEINVFVSNTLAGRNLGMFNDQHTNRQIPTGSEA